MVSLKVPRDFFFLIADLLCKLWVSLCIIVVPTSILTRTMAGLAAPMEMEDDEELEIDGVQFTYRPGAGTSL